MEEGKHSLVFDSIFFEVPGLRILQGVYLEVRPGRICGLFGRNGSGKSTLIKVAAGQLKPSGGLTIINGARLHKPSLRYRFSQIAYLPQTSMLPGEVRVSNLIRCFPATTRLLLDDDILSGKLDHLVDELSGGQRRYLELRLILSLGRSYLLLDEPFTGIEPLVIDRMSEVIVEAARQGIGVLATDHYHQYMLPIVDDAYLMVHKQCYHLNEKTELRQQLENSGYFGWGQSRV